MGLYRHDQLHTVSEFGGPSRRASSPSAYKPFAQVSMILYVHFVCVVPMWLRGVVAVHCFKASGMFTYTVYVIRYQVLFPASHRLSVHVSGTARVITEPCCS
nr:hypothetical protein CFP56_26022 [Quercus suber]